MDNNNKCSYHSGRLIDFDPAKDATNRRKHGVSLGEAERLDWDTAFIWRDERFAYDEWRMAGLGMIGVDLFYVSFVERGNTRRIISLRQAGKQEIRRYVRYLEGR